MNAPRQPPHRADHVGSFLRPRRLLEARDRRARGEIGPERRREVEDNAIGEIVAFQEDVGLRSVTDGESGAPTSTSTSTSSWVASRPTSR